jgi:hypothetical protein
MTEPPDPTALRLRLRSAGFDPLPLNGKKPTMKNWPDKIGTNAEEIQTWGRLYEYDTNTGLLTKYTPAIDIDILNPEAAEAAEALVRERFEERGLALINQPGGACPLFELSNGHLAAGKRFPQKALYLRGPHSPRRAILVQASGAPACQP